MISLFRHQFPIATAIQVLAEAGLFFAAALAAVVVATDLYALSSTSAIAPAIAFALVMIVVNGAVGVYRRVPPLPQAALFARAIFAALLGVAIAYLAFPLVPYSLFAQDAIVLAAMYALAGTLVLRHFVPSARATGLFSHRVLVIGTGPDAHAVEQALAESARKEIMIVGFFQVESDREVSVPGIRILRKGASLADTVMRLRVDEVIVAVREQRGGVLPLGDLLGCRLDGVRVTDLSRFFERVTGEVPIESLKASWLIYGDGFRKDRFRSAVKRTFDIAAASGLLVLASPIMALCTVAIRLESGGPVIYRQERVGRGGTTFTLRKFRSMTVDAERDGQARWAGVDDVRVSAVGRFIRRTRIDELPQIWNVLRGEMSFVGPRPERPCFVAELSKTIPFYGARHSVKPGITGWAQVRYTYAASVEDAARKLRFDLYYVKNHSLFLDLLILLETVRVVLFREGAR